MCPAHLLWYLHVVVLALWALPARAYNTREDWYSPENHANETSKFFQGQLPTARSGLPEKDREKVFLYIGILSSASTGYRRRMQRKAFCDKAQDPGVSRCNFQLGLDEKTNETVAEADRHHDVVFLNVTTDYIYSSFKVLYGFSHALAHFRFKFYAKLDDDTWANVPGLVSMLQDDHCLNLHCQHSRLYMGDKLLKGIRTVPLETDPGGKNALARGWVAADMTQATGLDRHPQFFAGGAWIVSQDVVRAVVGMHQTVGLRWHRTEDANLGLWLVPLNLRYVEHPGLYIYPNLCSLDSGRSCEQMRYLTNGLYDLIEARLCSKSEPWLALHKVESEEMMDYLLRRFAECDSSGANSTAG